MILRVYGSAPGDYQTVSAWWQARHSAPFPENQAPPLGAIVEIDGIPAGALFAYQSLGIGVAFLEFGVTRPGTSLKLARMIFTRLLHGITTRLRETGFGLLRCFAETPAMARALRMFGFEGTSGNLYLIL